MLETQGAPTASSDAAAIGRSLDDPGEFYVIADRHLGAIHSYLQRRVGVDLADDLAAETFAEAFSSRARFQLERPSALPWLYGIAANLLRSQRRLEERRLRAYGRAVSEAPHRSNWESVDERLDARATRPALALALAGLSARNREVLLLFAWAELSYEEIAQALDISPGTVRSRLNRARTSVARALTAAGDHAGGHERPPARHENGAADG